MKKFYLLFTSLIFWVFFCNYAYSQGVWVFMGEVSGTGMFPAISVSDSSTVWVSGNHLLFKSVNSGINFVNVTGNLPANGPVLYSVCGINANTCFVGDAGSTTSGAAVYGTTNGGINWNQVLSTGGTQGCIKGIIFSKTNPNLGVCLSDPPAGAGSAFWIQKTTNGGSTWVLQSPSGISNSIAARNSLFVIDENFYGFGTENVQNSNTCYIVYTSNGGSSWINKLVTVPGTAVNAIAVSSDKIYGIAVTNQSLPLMNRTIDGFSSIYQEHGFNMIGGNPAAKWVYGTRYVYIGATQNDANGSIEESSDGGKSWTQMYTDGLSSISQMDIVFSANKIYGYAVITNIGKVIKLTKQLIGVIRTSTVVPSRFYLYQNYPNPFNPSTKIHFDIPGDMKHVSNVKVTISDLLGREIAILVNEKLKPGAYEVEWNSGNYPSGVYFYRLTTDNFTEAKKMILVK